MITVMHDGINISRIFTSLINKLSDTEVTVVHVQSGDFKENGLICSIGLPNLVRKLTNRPIRNDAVFSKYLKGLDLIKEDIPDFDLSLWIAETLWIYQQRSLWDFYSSLTEKLKLKKPLVPLIKDIPNTIIRVSEVEGDLNTMEFLQLKRIGEIKEIVFNNKEKFELENETKNIIQNSDLLILFQLSPLSMYFLGFIDALKAITESHKGHIIYILPHELSLPDRKILEKFFKNDKINGLIETLEGLVDIIIFDKNYYNLIGNLQDLDMTMFPISFEEEKTSDIQKSIEELIRIINSLIKT